MAALRTPRQRTHPARRDLPSSRANRPVHSLTTLQGIQGTRAVLEFSAIIQYLTYAAKASDSTVTGSGK
jgi:hypothetical protein